MYLCLDHIVKQGRNHGWKVEGDQGLGPNTVETSPAPGERPGWVLGAGRGRPLPLWGLFRATCMAIKLCFDKGGLFKVI